jgi:hypothetical protein
MYYFSESKAKAILMKRAFHITSAVTQRVNKVVSLTGAVKHSALRLTSPSSRIQALGSQMSNINDESTPSNMS